MTVAPDGASDNEPFNALLSDRPRRLFQIGHRLFHEGEPPVQAFFMHSGLVKLVKTAEDGTETVIEFRGPGAVIGERSALDRLPQMTSAVAAVRTSVTPVSRDQLIAHIRGDAELALTMLTTFAGVVRRAVGHLLDLSVGDAESLVATRLMELADDAVFESIRVDRGGTIDIEMPMSQRELASWAGVSHRSATNVLRHLRDENLISTSRHHLEIRDPLALAKRCVATS